MYQTIAITGASRGLGFCLAQNYLERGARVFALVRSQPARLLQLRERFPQTLCLLSCDVSSTPSVEAAAQALSQQTDHLDLLINNAGINPDLDHPVNFLRTDFDQLDKTFTVNTAGPLRVLKALYPLLRPGALAVAVSSSAGSLARCQGVEVEYAYRMSKTALNMGIRLFSNTAQKDGVRALLMDPGWMKTDLGGPGATCDVEENARSIVAVLDQAASLPEDTLFVDYQGRPVPW